MSEPDKFTSLLSGLPQSLDATFQTLESLPDEVKNYDIAVEKIRIAAKRKKSYHSSETALTNASFRKKNDKKQLDVLFVMELDMLQEIV